MKRSNGIFVKGILRAINWKRENTVTGMKRYRRNIAKHEINLLQLMKFAARDEKKETLMRIKVKMIAMDNITERTARDRENTTGVL